MSSIVKTLPVVQADNETRENKETIKGEQVGAETGDAAKQKNEQVYNIDEDERSAGSGSTASCSAASMESGSEEGIENDGDKETEYNHDKETENGGDEEAENGGGDEETENGSDEETENSVDGETENGGDGENEGELDALSPVEITSDPVDAGRVASASSDLAPSSVTVDASFHVTRDGETFSSNIAGVGGTLLEKTIEFLDDLGIANKKQHDFPAEDRTIITFGTQLENCNVDNRFDIREGDKQMLSIYAVSPLRVPGSKRQEAMEFFTRANYGLLLGCFEMDLNDGEFRYKVCSNFLGMTVTIEALRYMYGAAAINMGRYFGGLMKVVYSGKDPAEAVSECEGNPEANTGAPALQQ